MSLDVLIALMTVSFVALMFSGIPVSFALLLSGVLAFWLGAGMQGLQFIGTVFWNMSASFDFLAAPLFVYMGFLLQQSGLIAAMIRSINLWLGRFPGSLGVVTLVSSTLFAAMSGSASAACATLGTLMEPEVRTYGFSKRFMLGIVNGGASLAPLIPPSVAFIIYSSLSETPITRLFAAGVIPGLMFSSLMLVYVILVSVFLPKLAPRAKTVAPLGERFRSLSVFPLIGAVIFIVLGGIFLGWFTPTESAAVGIVVAIAVLALYRRLRLPTIVRDVYLGSREAAQVAVFIMTLIISASVYSQVLNFLGVPQLVTRSLEAAGLGYAGFLILLSVALLIMGMFLNAVMIQVLTVPFVFPLLAPMGIDPIWFGVFLVVWIEIGTLTPPYGMDFFILQGVMKCSYADAVLGALPLLPVWILGVVLLCVFPELALWLPSKLY